MPEYDFFIKPPDRVVAVHHHTPVNPVLWRSVYYSLMTVIFFFLPAFLQLRFKGLFLWLAALGVVFRVRQWHLGSYDIVVSEEGILKIDVARGRLYWKVMRKDVIDIQFRQPHILIHKQKKVYLLPPVDQDSDVYKALMKLRQGTLDHI